MLERARDVFSRHGVVVICVCIFVFFSIADGRIFLGPVNLDNIARQFSVNAPLVIGQAVVLISGGLDLSVGMVLSMAAALTMKLQPHGVWVGVGAALAFGLLIGMINGLLVTKGGLIPFIATLGTMTVVYGLMLSYTGQEPTPGHDEGFTFWGAGSVGPIPTPLIVSILVLLMLTVYLAYTRSGRDLYAVGGSKDAAFLAGIPIQRRQFIAFVICGFLAALSGVLLASWLNSSTIHVGLDTNLLSLSAAIIGGASMLGGRGSAFGAFMGILCITLLTNGMDVLGTSTYTQTAVRAGLLIAVVTLDALSAARRRARSTANLA